MTFPEGLTLFDIAAVSWYIISWVLYSHFAECEFKGKRNLAEMVGAQRMLWMERMLMRELRVMDAAIVGSLMQSVTFFASTSILIIAGLLATLGGVDDAVSIIADTPFLAQTTHAVFESKLFFMAATFVYAFFKFSWSLRLFNIFSVMIAAAPNPPVPPKAASEFSRRAGMMSSLAGNNFNGGLRAYYFGLATLTWFVHPALFILTTAWVILIIYRREFLSKAVRILDENVDID